MTVSGPDLTKYSHSSTAAMDWVLPLSFDLRMIVNAETVIFRLSAWIRPTNNPNRSAVLELEMSKLFADRKV